MYPPLPDSGALDDCLGVASGFFYRWRRVDESTQKDNNRHGFYVFGR